MLLKLQQDPRYDTTVILPTWRPYEHGLNRVVKDLLESYPKHDFWLNIDADNPPIRNPLDLVEFNKDIIGLPTPVWHDRFKGDRPYYYNILHKVEGGWKPAAGDGLFEVDAIGSGCMLVHRRVLETLKRPVFMRDYDSDGIVTAGHDYLFCDNAKSAGFSVWAHTGYPCRHYVETDLHSQIESFFSMGLPQEGKYSGRDPIIVVGPPRTGSSSVAKILVKLGVFMGDKYLYLEDNIFHETGGTFEDADICKLSKLATSSAITKAEWQNRFRSLAQSRSDRVWGWKDPRTYKLIDEYITYFKQPIFIRCRRDRNPTVASMQRVLGWDERTACETYDNVERLLDAKLKDQYVISITIDDLKQGIAERKIAGVIPQEVNRHG